ncbi:MAG: hypothetical protein ACD_75C00669G0002 [uncultured bacterium]|nr:MAG: hypothetical protein ACD_75C00669G0002 [uncultured bacterium]
MAYAARLFGRGVGQGLVHEIGFIDEMAGIAGVQSADEVGQPHFERNRGHQDIVWFYAAVNNPGGVHGIQHSGQAAGNGEKIR